DQLCAQSHTGRTHRAAATPFGVELVTAMGVTDGCQVRAGAEGPTGARKDRDALIRVGFEVFERGSQFCGHGTIDGVAAFGSVHPDRGDRAFGFDSYVTHRHLRCVEPSLVLQ